MNPNTHTRRHSLCLLAKAYQVSAALVDEFARVEITVGFLMQVREGGLEDHVNQSPTPTYLHTNRIKYKPQVDKLVQLLESPVFVLLRLQLLDAAQPFQPALLKSLYGARASCPRVHWVDRGPTQPKSITHNHLSLTNHHHDTTRQAS